jgi:hypothetical protein
VKVISEYDERIAQVNCSCCDYSEYMIVARSKKWDPTDDDDYCFTFEFIDIDDYRSLWQRIKKAKDYLQTKPGQAQNAILLKFNELKEFYQLLKDESKTFLHPTQLLSINEPTPPKIRKEYGNWKPNDKPPKCFDAYLFETEDFAFGFFGEECPDLPTDRMQADHFSFDFKKEKYSWEHQQIWDWIRFGYKSGIAHHEVALNKYQLIDLLKTMSWCIKSYRDTGKDDDLKYIQLEVI